MKTNPLIKVGNWSDFSATIKSVPKSFLKVASLEKISTFSDLSNAVRDVQPVDAELSKSNQPRGIGLKSLKLTKGFEGFLGNIFNPTNEIYFVSWAWDFSNTGLYIHPDSDRNKENFTIPMRVGTLREFMGAGILLYPAKVVVGGIALRLMIWESDSDLVAFGETLEKITKGIKGSALSSLLTAISSAASVQAATLDLAKNLSIELAETVASILRNNSNDYVDFYGGYFPASAHWENRTQKYTGTSSEIEVEFF